MNDALRTILSLSVFGSILALLLFAGKPLLKNRVSKAFSYYIWLLVLLRLVVPVAAPVNVMGSLLGIEQKSVNNTVAEQTGVSAGDGTVQVGEQVVVPSNTQAVTTEPQSNKTAGTEWLSSILNLIKNDLLWIWLAGATVSLGWFITACACFLRRIRSSCVTPHSYDLAVFERMRRNKRVGMACSSYVATPMLIGVLRPVIVLPQLAYVQNGKGRELTNILRHELTHYKRKDVLYKWLVVAVTSLHWFNPLMPLIRREISRACELSCDEAVISVISAEDKQYYGNTLLALSANKKFPTGILATTLCEDKKELKERLISIMKYRKKPAWAVVLTLMLALLLAGCAAMLGVPKSSGSDVASENSALRAALAHNTNASPSDVAEPFQFVAEELLKNCDFPVILPTYFPSPDQGNEWKLFPEVKNGTFSIEIDQQQVGYTGKAYAMANWYGIISGNVGEPSEQPLEKQFEDGNIKANDISLPDGIKGKEYIDDPNLVGGTAITWETGQWSFFVNAYPEDTNVSTRHFADQIINAIKDSGQALPGSQGKFYFIYNGNMPMTEIYWEAENGVWYAIDTRLPNDGIKILQSMKILDSPVPELSPSSVTDLAEARQKVSYPIFIPTVAPSGLVMEHLTIVEGPPTFVRVDYQTKDGSTGLIVLNGPAGSGLASDPRKKGETIKLRSDILGHFLDNEPQFGGPILWWEEAGSYVALSGPDFNKADLVKIAASMSSTADIDSQKS